MQYRIYEKINGSIRIDKPLPASGGEFRGKKYDSGTRDLFRKTRYYRHIFTKIYIILYFSEDQFSINSSLSQF